MSFKQIGKMMSLIYKGLFLKKIFNYLQTQKNPCLIATREHIWLSLASHKVLSAAPLFSQFDPITPEKQDFKIYNLKY